MAARTEASVAVPSSSVASGTNPCGVTSPTLTETAYCIGPTDRGARGMATRLRTAATA